MASDLDITMLAGAGPGAGFGEDGTSAWTSISVPAAGDGEFIDRSGDVVRSVGGSMTALADGDEGGTAFGSRSRTRSL